MRVGPSRWPTRFFSSPSRDGAIACRMRSISAATAVVTGRLRIAQQGINVTFAIGIAKQKLLPRHLHGNDAEIFLAGCGQGQCLKAPVARSVEDAICTQSRSLCSIARHYLAIGMAGHADEPGQLLFAGLQQTLPTLG